MPRYSRSTARAGQPTPGAATMSAVAEIVRWASRADVRQRLLGKAGHGLSANDVTLLRAVVASGPLRLSELATAQGVDKSTITSQVRRLEDRGLIARRPDPADGRAVLLVATSRGQRVRDAMNAAGAQLFEEMLAGWPDEERELLASMLARFSRELATRPAGSHGPAASFEDDITDSLKSRRS